MKQLNIIIFTVLISISICKAQTKPVITTEEEYNYMTKGYQMQLSGGLDMKKGYALDTPVVVKETSYSFSFIPLKKIEKDTVLVGYIVKAQSINWGNTYYYGIPFGDESLLKKCFTSIGTLDYGMTSAFLRAYIRFQTKLY